MAHSLVPEALVNGLQSHWLAWFLDLRSFRKRVRGKIRSAVSPVPGQDRSFYKEKQITFYLGGSPVSDLISLYESNLQLYSRNDW